jgi:hypothetical protein
MVGLVGPNLDGIPGGIQVSNSTEALFFITFSQATPAALMAKRRFFPS